MGSTIPWTGDSGLSKKAKYEPGTKPRRQPARHIPPLFLLLFVEKKQADKFSINNWAGELSVLAAASRGMEIRRKAALARELNKLSCGKRKGGFGKSGKVQNARESTRFSVSDQERNNEK